MAIKVEMPEFEARRLMEQWEERLLQIEGEASSLMQGIEGIKAQLAGKLPSPSPSPSNPHTVKKRKKGENLRVIQTYLAPLNGQGATVSEISQKVNIGLSSVNLVLTRHTDVFTKGTDGLWRIKR